MSCTEIQRYLTAYLDGELAPDAGSAVRGHLRGCASCRQAASDEAMLRDGLRQLPPVDPPPSLWAGVQAQLAAAEAADAERPAWRRTLARWLPAMPTFAAGALVAAAAVTLLWWRTHRGPAEEVATAPTPGPALAVVQPAPADAAPAGDPAVPRPTPDQDVTADLHGEGAKVTGSYAQVADELAALAGEARALWSADRKASFDTRVAELRAQIDRAADGRPRQHAYRELVRYLQRSVVRDDVALAGGGQ